MFSAPTFRSVQRAASHITFVCCCPFDEQNYNRHYAEYSGYWEKTTFLADIEDKSLENFYDSNTGKLLFVAPKDRTWDDWKKESKKHGWPSFRDNEVNWDYVRVLPNGETVSVDGTHLVSTDRIFCTGNVMSEILLPSTVPAQLSFHRSCLRTLGSQLAGFGGK